MKSLAKCALKNPDIAPSAFRVRTLHHRRRIRLATEDDAAAIVSIYAPLVMETAISMEQRPPSVDEMRERIRHTLQTYPWLVFDEGRVVGYAYAGPHRAREAYKWSAEVSIYLRENARGRGLAPLLYSALFAILRAQGYRVVLAGVAQPNDSSMKLHARCGFEPVGLYRCVAYKLGAWRDTHWWQLRLGGDEAPAADPVSLSQVETFVLDGLLQAHSELH